VGRRFPTPLIGLPTDEARYRTVVGIAAEADPSLSRAEFRRACRRRLTKPDSEEPYSETYVRRIVGSYAELGVVERVDGVVEPSPFATDWLAGETPFPEFLWASLRRSWVAMGRKPEGIEGLDRILRLVERADDPLSRGEIRERLAAEHGYEFNDQGIRGYPEVLQLLGLVERVDGSYAASDEATVERYKRRFRNADVFRQVERRLGREGSAVEPPSRTAKRDLMKYYMYRESGGWNKRRQWYETFWKDYLQPETRNGETADLRRKEAYREARNRRKSLQHDLRDRFDAIDGHDLSGLSTSVLERMAAAGDLREAQRIRLSAGSGVSRADLELLADEDATPYRLVYELYDWQREAADEWSGKGIAQVVTGAGKTVMALEVIRRWLAEHDDGVVTVVVPTRVLMRQWLTELVSTLGVPVEDVGWAGGGHKDAYEDRRVLVTIVNSAVKDDYVGEQLAAAGTPPHLLVADECHRYTGDHFSTVFTYPRTASLGLSATAVSREEDDRGEADELLLGELGEVYYELTYGEGIDRGLIPEFTIQYVGFDLAPPERAEYDRLSRKVSDAVKRIHQQYASWLVQLPGGFAQQLQTIRKRADGPTPAIGDYFQYTQERRDLVSNAVARQAITLRLLEDAVDAGKKTIVFQERIEQLEQLVAPFDRRGVDVRNRELSEDAEDYRARLYAQFDGLREVDRAVEELFSDPGYWPVMYHSGHSREVWNDIAMDWFREEDMANVMLSVKALVEGVDVPSADVGIVRVSSSSIRQRIQTLGRILRTGEDASAQSTLYVLYARDTVDERIFREYDWEEELASAKVEHRTWEHADGESHVKGTLREATPEELPPRPEDWRTEVDVDELELGDSYPGTRQAVKQVSVDSRGELFEKTRDGRRYLESDSESVREAVSFVHRRKGGGAIIVNEAYHLLTVLEDGPVFLGTVESLEVFDDAGGRDRSGGELSEPPETDERGPGSLTDEPDDDLDDLFG
jgi:superfamily II DNA or RNA helicase